MSVVKLHQERPFGNVSQELRRIADEIEAGTVEWPVTTAVLLLGHVTGERPVEEGFTEEIHWRTYGLGPRNDVFTVRGLIATCLNRWNHLD